LWYNFSIYNKNGGDAEMTDEMRVILDSKEKRIAIQAFAGTGKSTTMLEYVKENKAEKILFLVYNKEMQLDFQKKASKVAHNCTISTIHSIAFRWYMKQGYSKKELRNITIVDIKNHFSQHRFDYSELSRIKFYFDMFLCSRVDRADEMVEIRDGDSYLFKYAQELFDFYSSKSTYMSHNVYLKMFQLAKVKLPFETLIFDEFNDVNDVMVDVVLNNLDKKVMVVGDEYQNLNSFNFTVSGLSMLIKDYGFKQYNLTNSFRVSEKVANLSSRYLTYMHEEEVKFSGLSSTYLGALCLTTADSKTNQISYLCRTRLGGLKEVLDLIKCHRGKKIYYVGGLDGFGIRELERVLKFKGNVYLGGEKFHISKLRKMVKDGLDDSEVNKIINLYDFAKGDDSVIEVLRRTETTVKEEADIIMQTAHSSKGLTLQNVMIGRDFKTVESMKRDLKLAQDGFADASYFDVRLRKSDINLLYVALTRATGVVDIGCAFHKDSKIESGSKIDSGDEY
jgi:superfamily I DNA/RNA helicase